MPRRTHPATRTQTRQPQPAPETPALSYENMARDLVDRGLATSAILDHRQAALMKPGEGA